MGIIRKIISAYKEKVKLQNEMCDDLVERIDAALQEIFELFSDDLSYVNANKKMNGKNVTLH